MDIYWKLPYDIRSKIFMHFRHPVACLLNAYPWVFAEIYLQWPAPITTERRIDIAKMINDPRAAHFRQRCGCTYYEQHQVCCNDIPEEELETWDPVIHQTYIQQAIQKHNMLTQLLKATNEEI